MSTPGRFQVLGVRGVALAMSLTPACGSELATQGDGDAGRSQDASGASQDSMLGTDCPSNIMVGASCDVVPTKSCTGPWLSPCPRLRDLVSSCHCVSGAWSCDWGSFAYCDQCPPDPAPATSCDKRRGLVCPWCRGHVTCESDLQWHASDDAGSCADAHDAGADAPAE